jgi:pimeloyl-ACP methyl ester carboxylesterase
MVTIKFRRKALSIGALLLLLPQAALFAKESSLYSVELIETLSPKAIDREVGQLFGTLPAPQASYSVDCFLIRFESSYQDGEPAVITAQLFLPRVPPDQLRMAYVFAPGTTGILDACRPSREHIAGIRWGLYRAHVLAFSGQGVVGLLPDYTGFGDPERLQPVYNAEAEGRMMLDGVRALYRFWEDREGQGAGDEFRNAGKLSVFVAGFSQGGHAAFAAADLRLQYAPEVRLAGVIGYGPTTNLEALFREFPVVAPMAVYSFSRLFRDFDPSKILADRWLASLEQDVTRQCIGGMQSYYPRSPRQLFRPSFAEALLSGKLEETYPEIHRILQRHSTGLRPHRVPSVILQGRDDVVVSPESQMRFVRQLCAAGNPVLYLYYPDSRHDTRQIGFNDAMSWMKRLAAGAPTPTHCQRFGQR